MKSWLEPLIDPGALIRSAQQETKPDDRSGLALLIEAQFLIYRRSADEAGWPQLGEAAPKNANLGKRLLGALGLHFVGDAQAEDEYLRVMKARDSTLSTAGTILLAIFYRDSGRLEDALGTVRRRALRATALDEKALLGLHLGLRLAEAGNWVEASEETQTAFASLAQSHDWRWSNELAVVAAHNRFQFDWRRRIAHDPFRLPRRSQYALNRGDLLVSAGLAKYLDTQYDSALADPYVRTITFQAEDETESRLQGALLRSEVLADWERINRDRRLLRSFSIISRLGTRLPVAPAALELLRRAGDDRRIALGCKNDRAHRPYDASPSSHSRHSRSEYHG